MYHNADEKAVKIMGRSLYRDGVRYLGNSASCVEFIFTGGRVRAELTVYNLTEVPEKRACIAVIADDRQEEAKRFVLESGEHVITLFDAAEEPLETEGPGMPEGDESRCSQVRRVKIRIQKLSEAQYGVVGIRSIQAEGKLEPTPDRERRIEFIGDSITCGYGVEGTPEGTFATREENPLKGYAVLAAQALSADYQLVSRSGIGIISNWVEGARQHPDTAELMPELYLYTDLHGERILDERGQLLKGAETDHSRGMVSSAKPARCAGPERWDWESFCPQLIVIHVGNNDASYVREDPGKAKEFAGGYGRFLQTVRRHNPGAVILCTLGLFSPQLCSEVERCAREAGSERVHFLRLEQQNPEDGLGPGEHPGPVVQQKAARQLTARIREIMGW